MENKLPLKNNTIQQVYFEGQEPIEYKIPIYQRNYAWEEDQIATLVKDVYDSMMKDDKEPYYIGTLVTYKRSDVEYEVIDGQQRLTTIYLVLKALGLDNFKNKLTYAARPKSEETLRSLPRKVENPDTGIRNGFVYAEKAIKDTVEADKKMRFEQYFLHHVHIIHYIVPKDVDLNHYFEVMNSRGEQLEKHEIAKSLLGEHLGKEDLVKFSRIWEACSEMSRYIQQVFPDKDVFGPNLDDICIDSFGNLPAPKTTDGKRSIRELLSAPVGALPDEEERRTHDRFQPIIDFPNFLLIVLKITRMEWDADFVPEEFTLDDKELLNEFGKALDACGDEEAFAKCFAINLLKARYFLDNYMVHHVPDTKERDGDNPWQLELYGYKKDKSTPREGGKAYPYNLFGPDTDSQKELVHLLSMFEVSFTAKQRKNYLFYCLLHLFEDKAEYNYLAFVRALADKYFFGIYLKTGTPGPNAFDRAVLGDGELNVEVEEEERQWKSFENQYPLGCSDIPLFVFNYADYRLWRKYLEELRGSKSKKGSGERKRFFEALGCSDFELDVFNNFYFSRTRKSLEHYYPRAKAVKDEEAGPGDITDTQVNCFGNFAMISADANSSGSNWDPSTKLDHYMDRKSDPVGVASLKLKIMMQMCRDNQHGILDGKLERAKGMEWNYEDMRRHQENMLRIIMG